MQSLQNEPTNPFLSSESTGDHVTQDRGSGRGSEDASEFAKEIVTTTARAVVVIPAYNEGQSISRTLGSLTSQRHMDGRHHTKDDLEIVVVDNASTDNTAEIVREFARTSSEVPITLLTEPEKSVVRARIRGMSYAALARDGSAPAFLASADADTIYPSHWLSSAIDELQTTGADAASCAGFFSPELWEQAPQLTQRYLSEVGTVFFPPETVQRLKLQGRSFLLTEELLRDFVRPISSAGLVLRRDAYLRAGGYRREFTGDGTTEIYDEGWRLHLQLDQIGANTIYVANSPFVTSPRRLVKSTTQPLTSQTGTSYRGGMTDIRGDISREEYAAFEEEMMDTDWSGVQQYVVRGNLVLRCISRPGLIHTNARYFDNYRDDFSDAIVAWRSANPLPTGGETIEFARQLTDAFFSQIIARIRALQLRA